MTANRYVPRLAAAALTALFLAACGNDYSITDGNGLTDSTAVSARILGACFMHGETCLTTYIDLGIYELEPVLEKVGVPAYVFPSVPEVEGGQRNPLDPHGLYNPFRLQNNVFAGAGRGWEMYLVYSANLNLVANPEPGVRLLGVGAQPDGERVRDLYLFPIRSEEEVLSLVDQGDVRIEYTGLTIDCPILPPNADDVVINLNPQYPLCPSP